MKKCILILTLSVVLVIGISFAALALEYNLKLGTIWTDADPSTAMVNKFSDLLKEKTNGNVNVKIFNNSQLGTLPDMLTGMKSGIIEMLQTRSGTYGWLEGASMFNICGAPFMWKDYDELEAFLQSDTAKKWFDEAAKATGVRVILAKGDTEARQLTSNKPIRSVDDFKGLKIRIPETALTQNTMKTLGAQPIVVPFQDLYLALRQNTVDAQENGFTTIKNKSLFEVQKYLMKTDYIREVEIFCISEKLWKSMPEDVKTKMIEAASEAADLGTQLTRDNVNEAFEFLKTNMEYIEIDVKSIQDKLINSNFYEEMDGQVWPKGTYAEVKAFKDAYEAGKK